MGLSDNTGIYTTGDHLHFGFRRLPFNQNNGYTGWEDPTPYLDKNFYNLPIDERYGRAKDWTSEFILRFKNPWVHKRLIRWYNRHPLSLTSREVNSIVYGGWGFDEAVNPILINNIYFLTKVEFREGKKPFCRMVVG
jgi:murein DD-endopeptidase MepM/ murein hydrolase activator NlpD